LRALCRRDDAYDKTGKPSCAWDDKVAREELVDALTRDAHAILLALDGETLSPEVNKAVALLATVVGQDIEKGEDGVFRIILGVAPNRVISTVDPEARHGHKTEARGFDGYKGHIAVDAESEIITATEVTPGNVGDASVAETLLSDVLANEDGPGTSDESAQASKAEVLGDASYGTADLVEKLENAGVVPNVKVQPPTGREGMFSQDDFDIDLAAGSVCCPAGLRVSLKVYEDGSSRAYFGAVCAACPLLARCTTSTSGRRIKVHAKHATLDRHRKLQREPEWKAHYRKVRPRVERKLAHMVRRRHGGRRARVRGSERVRQDFALLAASINLARLATLGVRIERVASAA
jgi:hypothetical protein